MAYKPIDILYLSSWYPNKYQPFVGNFVRRQAAMLAETHNVTVIHTVARAEESGFNLEKNVEGNLTEYHVYHQRGKTLLAKRKMQRAALNIAMAEIGNVDLLLTQILLPKGLQFIDAMKNFDCPWIHIEQGSYFRSEIRKKWSIPKRIIIKWAVRNIDQIYAVSNFLKKDMKSVFPKKDIKIISNHVDPERFTYKPKQKRTHTKFLHVSTLDEATKNPKGILDACKLLKNQGETNFSLLIICDEDSSKWREYANELELSDIITFEGAQEWDALPSFYHDADAFILNSVYETFSIVIAESWSTGTPVISTPVGIAFDLPTNLGYQTEFGKPESLAHSMKQFIENKNSFDGIEIQKAASKYSTSNVNEELRTLIKMHVK